MTPDKVLEYLKDWLETAGSGEIREGHEDYIRGWYDSKKDTLTWINALEKDKGEDEPIK